MLVYKTRYVLRIRWRNIMMSLFWDSCCGGHATSTRTWVPFLLFIISTSHTLLHCIDFLRSRKLYPYYVTIINNELKVYSRMMMFHSFLLWRILYLYRIHLQISYFNSIKLNLQLKKKILYSCHCRSVRLPFKKQMSRGFLSRSFVWLCFCRFRNIPIFSLITLRQ